MKGGSCINFSVESSLQFQSKSRYPLSATPAGIHVREVWGTEIPVSWLKEGKVPWLVFSSWGGGREGKRRLSVYTGYRDSVYLPTYIGGFLPAGLPVAVSRGEYTPARRFTGVWLGESQEACALLTMTNCPALRRHIYANLGTRVERARRLQPTNLLAPFCPSAALPVDPSPSLLPPSHPQERRDVPHRRFHATSKIQWITDFACARGNSLLVFTLSLAKRSSFFWIDWINRRIFLR